MILEAAPVITAALTSHPTCVIDARLALLPLGLVAIARLQTEFEVWLPRELRQVLREASTYGRRPERLMPASPSGARQNNLSELEAVHGELALWEAWPVSAELSGLRLYHLGDRPDESVVPAGTDRGLDRRCEQLQRGLHQLECASGFDRELGDTLGACFRDALALAAALQRNHGFVLTRLERETDRQPVMLDYLSAWGVPSREVPRRGGPAARPLRDAVVRSGVGALSWCDVPLAAVHVALPGYPVVGEPDPDLEDGELAQAWARALVHWHRLS